MRDLNVEQIKKLWVLDLVVRSGSLKKAALMAKVSPSAVSQTLTSLEQALGRRLLVREKGAALPTQEAVEILDVVRPAFEAFDKLRDLHHGPVPKMAWLNFGTYESIAIDILPGLVHSLREKIPDLKLGLRISRTGNLLTMVRKGELCSALITEVDDLERFDVKVVAEDRLGVYVSKRSPIATEGWKAIAEHGFGSLAPSKDGLPRYFRRFLKNLEPARPAILSDSFEALRATAASGVIAAVLPERVANRNDDLIEVIPPKAPGPKDSGLHKICVVSQANCDPEETEFLASISQRLLARRGQTNSYL